MKCNKETLVTIAVASTIMVAGLAAMPRSAAADDSTTATGHLDEAVEAWNFSGFSGSIDRTYDGGRWFDFAFPVWEGMGNDSVRITVRSTQEFENGSDGGGRFFTCAHTSQRFEGNLPPPPAHMTCFTRGSDGTWKFRVQVLGERLVEEDINNCIDLPWPFVGCEPRLEDRYLSYVPDENTWRSYLRRSDRPIAHFIFFAGPVEPLETQVTARWNDTVMAVTEGPYEDVFAYNRADFSSTLYVGALGPQTHLEGTLNRTLVEGDRSTLFLFAPHFSDFRGKHGYERPDGSRNEGHYGYQLWEASSQQGEWTFWADWAVGPQSAHHTVLRGLTFDWAEMPWEE